MTPQDHELILDYLHGRLAPEDGPALNALLARSAEARECLQTEAAIEMRLRELPMEGMIDQAAVLPARTVAPARGWLAPVAAGIALGILFATATWASVSALRREPEPIPLPVANGDFEVIGPHRIGGFPKTPGWWRGDAADCVGATGAVRPHTGSGMLHFRKTDGNRDGAARGFGMCDQWQLIDLAEVPRSLSEGEQFIVETEAWFNAEPFARSNGGSFHFNVYAISAISRHELNAIGSLWLRQSSAVLATASRRMTADRDPGTWEQTSLSLPLPTGTRFLLLHLGASAQPDAAAPTAVPAQYADSVAVRLRRVPRGQPLAMTR